MYSLMTLETSVDLKVIRKELGMSQAELADMIGVSLRTVQSCEQGWRNPGPAVEKAAILLLLAKRHGAEFGMRVCWDTVNCPGEDRMGCLVYQSRQGHLCWLLSGNICQGKRMRTWQDKKAICTDCSFFRQLLPEGIPTVRRDSVSSSV